VGDTDSEAVFCAILNALKDGIPGVTNPVDICISFLDSRVQIIQGHPTEVIFNFMWAVVGTRSLPTTGPGRDRDRSMEQLALYGETATFRAKLLDVDYNRFCRRDGYYRSRRRNYHKPLTEGWTEFKRGELICLIRSTIGP
jgi:glutamine amidotransferase